MLRKLFALVGLLGVVYALAVQHGAFTDRPVAAAATVASGEAAHCDNSTLATVFHERRSRVEVCGDGVVEKVLREDLQGSRHQRFIVRLASGQTIYIAHNMDIAPRIENLRAGEPLGFRGEYEWNGQGGIIHWTHHDPDGRHPSGWIRYDGRLYQ